MGGSKRRASTVGGWVGWQQQMNKVVGCFDKGAGVNNGEMDF